YNLHVVPEFRRQGLAKRLLVNAEEWARQQDLGSIALHVIDFNEQARRLYESTGYNLVATQNESCFYEMKVE
ncbi:MAG: GNAT family N-acetyltransferase, partial [Candidatus Bathyarchaeota archaeon]